MSDPGDRERMERIQQRLAADIADLLPRHAPVALLDFPNHDNIGDSAIWVAELDLLRRLGHRIAYAASWRGWNEGALRRALANDGTVLLSGGGNFGDTWPDFQRERERVVTTLAELPIVQLPQSLQFDSQASAEASARLLERHGAFTLMVRDRRSVELATEVGVETVLAPDMAFALELDTARRPGVGRVLWLLREDRESRASATDRRSDAVDWPAEVGALRLVSRASTQADRAVRHLPAAWPQQGHARLQERLARHRLKRGLDLLAEYDAIVTDRLHVHLIATLLGIPNVALDNSYGKLRAMYETWTASSEVTWWADSLEEAESALAEIESVPPPDP